MNVVTRLLASSLIGLICAAAAARQESMPPAAPASSMRDTRGDIAFPGGTVQQYIDAVSKAFGSANAGVFPGAESLRVAPVQLKYVSREEALHLLEAVSGGVVAVLPRGNVFAVVPDQARAHAATNEVRVWSLAPVLARIKPEDALSAVKAAIDLAGEGAQVKFHAETTLLIISGTPLQLDAAQRTVDRLESVAEYHALQEHSSATGKQTP